VRNWLTVVTLLVLAVGGLAACADGGEPVDAGSDGLGEDGSAQSGIEYRVIVTFNETAEQADLDETAEILADYDPLMRDFLIRESFPPTGDATLVVDDDGFCDEIVAELEAKSYVDSVDCGPPPEPTGGDPDEPVSSDDETSLACAEGAEDCEDIPNDTCFGDGVGDDCETEPGAPERPSDAGNPPSTGAGEYQLRISFGETVLQDQLDETGALIASLAPDAEYLIQESFPPTGIATFYAESSDTCLALVPQLDEQAFVDEVACELVAQAEPGDYDPDEPVTNDLR